MEPFIMTRNVESGTCTGRSNSKRRRRFGYGFGYGYGLTTATNSKQDKRHAAPAAAPAAFTKVPASFVSGVLVSLLLMGCTSVCINSLSLLGVHAQSAPTPTPTPTPTMTSLSSSNSPLPQFQSPAMIPVPNFLAGSNNSNNNDENNNNNNSNSNSNIGDVLCTMDDLERANDSQLNIIFRELQQSNFFRHFVVDLEIKCRHQLKKPTNDKNEKEKEKESDNKKESDNAATKKPTKTSSSSSSSSSSFSSQSQSQSQSFSSSSPLSFLGGSSPGGSDNDGDGDGDDFQCSGGADELDEDATPLCSVDAGESFDEKTNDLFSSSSSSSSSPTSPLAPSSSASASSSWEDQTTDKIVRDPDDPPCDEDDENGVFDIPDSFWMDMCSNIHKGEGTKIVNLSLNPERNTYYNGTHIWKAIYDENCITTNDSCLEERVLYRLLSGMHTSTTLSIARNYYPPSKRTGRTDWEANPQYFMERFQDHPEHIRNLHFSYVVLLRAIKKASAYLYDYDVSSGVPVEDASTAILLRRLLDTTILRSCSGVFSAFDETVMFRDNNSNNSNNNNLLLRESFKGVFHNISSILDCVQCQQCKLHGKLTMLGYGTALKILFVKSPKNLVLERNEVVALVNTAARLSENLVEVRELTALYWEQERKRVADLEANTETGRGGPAKSVVYDSDDPSFSSSTSSSFAATAAALAAAAGPPYDSLDVLDLTVGVISAARRDDLLSVERETELIQMALVKRHPELMILGKHYHNDPERFATLSESLGADSSSSSTTTTTTTTKALLPVRPPDAIVVGSGLAGLAASLNILDRGGTVVILEKEHLVGGNSNKASSGINGYCPNNSNNANTNANATTCFDSIETFRNDTIRSAGAEADVDLINVLVTKSSQAVSWLRDRADVDLSLLAQLGGHSTKRTHRPSNGMAGAEIVYHMQKAVRSFEKTGRVKILVDTKVKELLTEEQHGGDGNGGRVIGVRAESTTDGSSQTITILADNVILATGGFASDRSSGSYLDQYRPELMSFPATAGGFSTGDGIALATTLGAATRDMDKVQIHPTGWVDPKDPTNPTKILAAELMRGVGGILIDSSGKRFANELGTRAYVTDRMLKHDKEFVKTGKWNPSSDVPTFFLVLSSSAAADGKKHVDLYTHKGLLTKVEGIDALSKHTKLDQRTLTKTMRGYQSAAKKGSDEFGKTSFRGVPSDNLTKETFYVGEVTPVLHYCMGGIKINPECSVIREDGRVIEGLHAAGEVTGGVHGANRLGGNSLLECTVFGTVVGQKVPVKEGAYRIVVGDEEISTGTEQSDPDAKASNELPDIRMEELAKHNTKEDLWVAIHGVVYDFTEFAEEHPAGFKSIFDLAGTDGTAAFDAVHNVGMLDDFEQDKRGVLV